MLLRAFDAAGEAFNRWLDRQVVSDNLFRGVGALLLAAFLSVAIAFMLGVAIVVSVVILMYDAVAVWRFLSP